MASLTMDDDDHFPHDDAVEDLDSLEELAEKKPAKKKRDGTSMRKAPQAPKRFKSSYICFFMAKQPEIKEALGDKASVTEISRRSAQMWRNLPADERAHWDDIAAKDKQRYMVEKATYTGPWQVPWKRARKDPTAPKRPMSAFLYFSQAKRREIKNEFPDLKNTEISRKLGEMWRSAPFEEREPHIVNEREEREKYKEAMVKWRVEHAEKEEAQRKAQMEQLANMPPIEQMGTSEHQQQGPPDYGHGDPNMMYSGWGYPPPGYGPPPTAYPSYGMYGQYAPQPHPAYHMGGKPMMVLGPNGMPLYPNAPYPAVSAPSSFEENEPGTAPAPHAYPPRSNMPEPA